MVTAVQRIRLLQSGAIAVGVLPLAVLGVQALRGELSPNPVEDITHVTGEWGLRFLIATLAVTPVRRLLRLHWVAPLRRTLGLTAFSYVFLHMLTYLWLEHFFDWQLIVEDVLERRYITAGMAAVLCLVPLAATSTRGMARRLGRHWKTLHRLSYVAATLGVIHFFWLQKADYYRGPILYGTALAAVLGARVWLLYRSRLARARRGAGALATGS